MSLDDVITRDAQRIIGNDGTLLTISDGVTSWGIKCVPRAASPGTFGENNHATLRHKLVLAVAKADLPAAVRNKYTISGIPGAWMEKATTQTARVVEVMHDRADPGVWLLAVAE